MRRWRLDSRQVASPRGCSQPGCRLTGCHSSQRPDTRISPNRRDPGPGGLALDGDYARPIVASSKRGDARCLPADRSHDRCRYNPRRPGEAGASAGSTRRCLGRLRADHQPQSDPNRHGNPLATRYAGVWECDARQSGVTGPTAPARSWRVAQAGGARDRTAPRQPLPESRTRYA